MLCQEDKYLIIKYLKIFIILKLFVFDTILFDNGQGNMVKSISA
jgi:hypothetical protein